MRKAPFKRVALTPDEQRKWDDTLAALTWIAPGFVHIIYTMLASSGDKNVALFTHDMPYTAATDGYQLIFNPKRFFGYNLLQRVFGVLHEVMHEILNHCRLAYNYRQATKVTLGAKTLEWDDDYANRIQDHVINAILIASKMGEFSTDWLFDTNIATEHDDWLTAYFRNWKQKNMICPPKMKIKITVKGNGQGDGEGTGMPDEAEEGRFDIMLDPHQSKGTDPHEVPERSEAEWAIAVNSAMEIQRAQGKLPSAMEMFFKELLKPNVDWTDHIEGLIVRLTGSGAYDWRRLDRRLVTRHIGAPGLSGYGADLVVIAMDSSGSIYADPSLIDRWLGELSGIMEDVNPRLCLVIWCDAEVQRVDELTDPSDIKSVVMVKGAKGGGGTSFIPVFDYIHDEGLTPDVLLYLTDGYGSFPEKEPADYPVIWGTITGEAVKYPFGAVVQVPINTD